MIKVIQIRQSPKGGFDGTANYCKALYDIFQDDPDVNIMPIVDYPATTSKIFNYYYKAKPLKEAIKEADIVHINGYTAMGTAQALYWAKKLGKKVIYTAHWHPFPFLRRPFLGKCFFNIILKPFIKHCATEIVAINNEDYEFFHRFHKQTTKIPHFYTPIKLKQNYTKQKNMILFVGRINDPVKRADFLYHIPEGKYEIHCVGKGNLDKRTDIHQHIDISNKALSELYAKASLLVIPSKYEAFSYVALEALSYGTPVVMSDRVRIADHLQGIEGYSVFKYNDQKDFLQKIDKTIGIIVDTDCVLNRFSIKEIKKAYKKLYLK